MTMRRLRIGHIRDRRLSGSLAMRKKKTFDSVELKNAIQARLRKEYEGLSPQEVRKRPRAKLEASNDPLARKWQRLIKAQPTNKAAVHRP